MIGTWRLEQTGLLRVRMPVADVGEVIPGRGGVRELDEAQVETTHAKI